MSAMRRIEMLFAIGRVVAGAAFIAGCFEIGACGSDQSTGGGEGPGSGGTQIQGEGGAGSGVHVDNAGGQGEEGGQAGRASELDASGVDGRSDFPLSPPSQHRIAVGDAVACVLSESSDVLCWGHLGSQTGPQPAMAGPYRTLAMGPSMPETICAIAADGAAACAPAAGGSHPTVRNITDCLPTGKFSEIGVDRRRTAYVALVGTEGALQVITPSSCDSAVVPSGINSVRRAVVAEGHACAIYGEGSVSCWKVGGDAESTLADTFVDVAADPVVACGATTSGKVRCWSADGTEDSSDWHFAAAASKAGSPVVQLATEGTGRNLCALLANGKVLCSQEFQLGSGQSFKLPERETLVEIAVGFDHVCGVRPDDTVLCLPLSCSGDCPDFMTAPDGFKTASR